MKKRWARAILYESLFFTIIISLFVIKITYSVVENDNVVEIDSKVLSDRNELSKYASSIAKQYLYKHNLTEYEQYSMDDRGLRSEEHTSELQSRGHLVCRLLLEKKKN